MTPAEIRTLRFKRHLTQAEFGQAIGVHGETVKRWERGKHVPQPRWCRRLVALAAQASTPAGLATAKKYGRVHFRCIQCGDDVPHTALVIDIAHQRRHRPCGPVVWEGRPPRATRAVILRRIGQQARVSA